MAGSYEAINETTHLSRMYPGHHGLHLRNVVEMPRLQSVEGRTVMITLLLLTLINVVILLCNVTILNAVLKAYSEMTKTKLLRKMTSDD